MTECMIVGRVRSDGYARVTVAHARRELAHRFVWMKAKGPIPEGMVLHHICENRACSNIEHLGLLSRREHAQHHNPPMQCGHDPEEFYVSSQGWSRCHACDRRRNREYAERRKGVVSRHA